MPRITVKTPADGSDWSPERLAIVGAGSVVIDGEPYPIVDASLDGKRAKLVIDTGDGGPALSKGQKTDAGTVQ